MYHTKNRILKITISFLIYVCVSGQLYAQEVLSGYRLDAYTQSTAVHQKMGKVLELPFLDDFSDYNGAPDSVKWSDKDAFVNEAFGINPPSRGVVTLDAINQTGDLHYDLYEYPFSSDTLSSQPINLAYPSSSGIFLSFYYQAQGRGDAPEPSDSLLLEFYSPSEDKWAPVWFANGGLSEDFAQVILPVTEARFLQEGFRFRFRNWVSLSGSSRPSLVSNADFWHIDYVYLNKGRTFSDITMHDIAFIEPIKSLITGYESIPWSHYKNMTTKPMVDNLQIIYKNNDNTVRHINDLNCTFADTYSGDTKQVSAGSRQIPPALIEKLNIPLQGGTFQYEFPSNPADSAVFVISGNLFTDNYDLTANNHIRYEQKFYNYYAYDDGSAEVGYGLTGEGTKNAKFAMQFVNYMPQDSLTGVQFYFNKTAFDATASAFFYLTVWNNKNGRPDSVIYKRSGNRPVFTDSLNQFVSFPLKTYNKQQDTAIAVPDTFYVGWTQVKQDLLNVGFDFNRQSQTKSFYNIVGAWQASEMEGTVMIRPVFKNSLNNKNTTDKTPLNTDGTIQLSVYPVPASERVYIAGIPFAEKPVRIQVYDLSGRLVYENLDFTDNNLDVSQWQHGIYLLHLTDFTTFVAKQKIVVQ